MQLQAAVHQVLHGAGGLQLDLRRRDEIQLTAVEQLHAVRHVRLRGLQLRGQLRELELRVLEVQDALAEHVAAGDELRGLGQHALGDGHGGHGHAQPPLRQLLGDLVQPLALLAHEVGGGHPDVVEEQLGGVRGLQAHLVQLLARGVALVVLLLHEEQAEAVPVPARGGAAVRAGKDQGGVAGDAVADERLLAVEHVLVAVAHGPGAHPAQVGAGARLGEGDARDHLPAQDRGQPALLLLVRAVREQVRQHPVVLQVEREPQGQVARAHELLVHHAAEAVVGEPHALVVLRDGQPEQPGLRGLVPDATVHHVLGVPLRVVRGHLALVELAGHRAELLVLFVVEAVDHGVTFHWERVRRRCPARAGTSP